MIKLFIFMSSLIFYNQDYHCVLHQVLHIFINQVLHIFLYQEGRGHILIRIQNQGGAAITANQFYPYWGERLICKCSDGGNRIHSSNLKWRVATIDFLF